MTLLLPAPEVPVVSDEVADADPEDDAGREGDDDPLVLASGLVVLVLVGVVVVAAAGGTWL
jgi:hypothetical protein